MLFIFFNLLFYLLLIAISTSFLNSFTVPVFLGLLYFLPVCINILFTKIQKNKTYKLISSLLFPTFSLLSYFLFAYITSKSGAWLEFINMNTLSNGDISVDIAKNLFSSSQVSFVVLVYYASSIAYYLFTNTAKKKENKGVKYA
ncbi:Msa family membrane protein [Streptococcus pluranimalium]|uniref:Msa family membrane protein n=1 Tax=Streptococcus TaxID=1301 RepID=UPI0014792DE3|nr:Msa family membrane protein [Streptococcus hyovaginalis]